MKINHKQLRSLLEASWETKQPLFLEGTMGIGKSAAIAEFAKEKAKELGIEFIENGWEEGKFGLIDTRLSQCEPTDLRGVPVPDLKNGTTNWLKPSTMPKGKSFGLWLFDEMNLANQSVQAAAYQIIRDRQIDDTKIPEGWLIIAAGNTAEDKANIFDMPAPLCNRFTHATLEKPSPDEWTIWAVRKNIHKNVVSYIQFRGSHLHTFNPENEDKAFGTPRSWEMVSNNLYVAEKLELDEKDTKILVASCVGEGIANEFMAYKKLSKKINLDQIIKNPEKFVFPEEADMKYAIITGLSEKYSQNPKILQNLVKIWQKSPAEFTIIGMKLAKAYRDRQFIKELRQTKEWVELSREFSKYLL
jgi:hypothetical protein